MKVSFCAMLVCKKWLPLGVDERGPFARCNEFYGE